MTSSTVYLISGANRGLGLGFVEALAKRTGTIVFAGARDPSKAVALQELAAKNPNVVHIVKLTSGEVEDNKAAAAEIERIAGRLDVVIANAAIGGFYGPLVSTPIEQFAKHYHVNTVGPIVLFQAVYPLLLKSTTGAPQFNVISTAAGSIEILFPNQAAPYGASKAAVNFITRLIHREHEKDGIIAMAIHPGWVATDSGNIPAASFGLKEAPVSIAQSVAGVLSHMDGATRAEKSGKFINYVPSFGGNIWEFEQAELPW